jgi:hypothetical protein
VRGKDCLFISIAPLLCEEGGFLPLFCRQTRLEGSHGAGAERCDFGFWVASAHASISAASLQPSFVDQHLSGTDFIGARMGSAYASGKECQTCGGCDCDLVHEMWKGRGA